MKRFLKHFRVLIILDAIALIAIVAALVIRSNQKPVERENNACPTERIYDYADRLTDAEEDSLRSLIAEAEGICHCDIVIVTLDTPYQELMAGYEPDLVYPEDAYYNMAMNYADDFYDNAVYGYNQKWGDGCLFVDNFAPEADGWRYYWFSTCGQCEDRYSSYDIASLEDDIYEVWEDADPYDAYVVLVNSVRRHMKPKMKSVTGAIKVLGIITAVIAALIYMGVHLKKKVGEVTTMASTYLGQNYRCVQSDDKLISQNVSRVKLSSSSGSSGGGGGGGHHTSSGGHSHGGGGGRH